MRVASRPSTQIGPASTVIRDHQGVSALTCVEPIDGKDISASSR
jgi:hypothetical protein